MNRTDGIAAVKTGIYVFLTANEFNRDGEELFHVPGGAKMTRQELRIFAFNHVGEPLVEFEYFRPEHELPVGPLC